MKTPSAMLYSAATAFFFTLAACPLQAQQAGYSAADLEALIAGGVSADNVLERANRGCLNFRVSAESDARLKRAGAGAVLISALHSSCRTGAARITPDAPRPKPVVKHDTVVVREPVKHDTVPREVVRPDPAIPLATYISRDFATDHHAFIGEDANCAFGFISGGYRIMAVTAREICESYESKWIPASVRIAATFNNLGGTSESYAWGISLGIDSMTKGTYSDLYMVEIDTQGQFSAWQRLNQQWTRLLPNMKASAFASGVGSTNSLRVDVRGHSMVFYVNNQPVGRYEANAPVQGGVGIGIFGPKPGATILVTNLRVTQIE